MSYCTNCGGFLNEDGSCPYCGKGSTTPSLNTPVNNIANNNFIQDLDGPIYDEVECKEGNLTFFSFIFPLIFGVAFGWAGIVMPLMISKMDQSIKDVWWFFIPFALVGIISMIIAIRKLYIALVVALFSKEITGRVIGYRNDNVLYNGMPGQVAEILILTNVGKKVLLYQIGGASRPFPIGQDVKVKVYKNYYKILKQKQSDVWNNI